MESLIANTGLHFKTTFIDINPNEPLLLPSGKTLKYTFIEKIDFFKGQKITLDVCSSRTDQNDVVYVPVNHLVKNKNHETTPNGLIDLDEIGVVRIKSDAALQVMESYPSTDPRIFSINSLSSYRFNQGAVITPAFNLLLGKWLPMPMFEKDESGRCLNYPIGWCRVRIDAIGNRDKKGTQRYRLVWAYDTRLSSDLVENSLRPSFLAGSGDSKEYGICDRADLLLGRFLQLPDGKNDAPIGDYLVSLFGINLNQANMPKYKFIAYYIYFINYLRLCGATQSITLYNKTDVQIPVDMSIDIGNSRTCAMLFEQGDFTKAMMLRMRDLSEPWRSYDNAFDMRIVFRRADFGGDITLGKSLFQWPSLVRVGDEAKHLVYRAAGWTGESERTTNYSSPKRYLWDDKPFNNRWELMVVADDPTNVKVNPQIYLEGFTDHFADDGTFIDNPSSNQDLASLGNIDKQCHYSRRSLMTFVMIEIMQQAQSFINSGKFREKHGKIDCRRYLRNIIITCPTAMPLKEQLALRQAAKNASLLLQSYNSSQPEMTIIPDPAKMQPTDDPQKLMERGWLYDEAFACQLVYLYAELTQRYSGRIDHFFKLKGHQREELTAQGIYGNALTIGSIDIGAGTTDVMITAYGQKGNGKLTPTPLYYDSFYTAGDDIIHNIIRDVVLEGHDYADATTGSIGNALAARIMSMPIDQLLEIPRIKDTAEYRDKVTSIKNALNEDEASRLRRDLVNELMHHFFAEKSARQDIKDRRCRLDFCTQVSIPMAQFFLELLKQGRPQKTYTFDDLFPNEQPADYLLEHFQYHFGFSFKELNWRFDPQIIGNIVRDTMEPLIKALSVVMYALHCDILVLSGRPTNLQPITELVLKYIPIAPHRLVLLNQYRVGRFFPLATEQGYFQESQKAVVAVGAEIGYLASTQGFNGLVLDFSTLAKTMKSTARYIGMLDVELSEVREPILTPEKSTAILKNISVFPCYLGCKQFDAPKYTARPLYVINNNSKQQQLTIMLQRNYHEDREQITIEDVTDSQGEIVPIGDVDLHMQTLTTNGMFWMDEGAFRLTIQAKGNSN